MTISDIGALADLLAALGVIGSLLFLAIQVRSNTTTMRNQFYEWHRTNLANTLVRTLDREVAKVIEKGRADYDSLDGDEKLTFGAWAIDYLLNLEGISTMGQQGILRPEIVEMVDRRLGWFFAEKGAVQWWQNKARHPIPRDNEQRVEEFLAKRSPKAA